MHRYPLGVRSLLAAGLAVVAAGALLTACSRPTAVPTLPSFAPGPEFTYEPPPKPGDAGYPPKTAATNPPPEGYPGADGVITETLTDVTPTVELTATVTVTP